MRDTPGRRHYHARHPAGDPAIKGSAQRASRWARPQPKGSPSGGSGASLRTRRWAPKAPRSKMLAPEEEAMVIALRKSTRRGCCTIASTSAGDDPAPDPVSPAPLPPAARQTDEPDPKGSTVGHYRYEVTGSSKTASPPSSTPTNFPRRLKALRSPFATKRSAKLGQKRQSAYFAPGLNT